MWKLVCLVTVQPSEDRSQQATGSTGHSHLQWAPTSLPGPGSRLSAAGEARRSPHGSRCRARSVAPFVIVLAKHTTPAESLSSWPQAAMTVLSHPGVSPAWPGGVDGLQAEESRAGLQVWSRCLAEQTALGVLPSSYLLHTHSRCLTRPGRQLLRKLLADRARYANRPT